jgi:hypothetical protein
VRAEHIFKVIGKEAVVAYQSFAGAGYREKSRPSGVHPPPDIQTERLHSLTKLKLQLSRWRPRAQLNAEIQTWLQTKNLWACKHMCARARDALSGCFYFPLTVSESGHHESLPLVTFYLYIVLSKSGSDWGSSLYGPQLCRHRAQLADRATGCLQEWRMITERFRHSSGQTEHTQLGQCASWIQFTSPYPIYEICYNIIFPLTYT